MSNRAKINILLSVTLLVLFAFIYVEQRETAEAPARVADLDPAAVLTVDIDVRGRGTIRLARGDGGWRMLEPLEIPVETRRVAEIIDGLSIRSQASYPASRMNFDELELGDDPQARLVVDGETWIIGGRNPLEGARYILHGDTVHLASDVLYFRLTGEPAGFASRQLLPAGETISRIELPDFTVIADGEEGWTLEPGDPGVDGDALQALVDAWRNAQATRVTTHDTVGAAPRAATHARIYLEDHDEPLVFTLHATGDDFFLVREDHGLAYRMAQAHASRMTELARAP